MSIRQFRPKRDARRGKTLAQIFWLNLFFLLTIALQIAYPLVHANVLRWITIATVISGAIFAVIDALINYGSRFTLLLVLIVLPFSFAAEAVGQATQWPFGKYSYSQTLGVQLLNVPLLVPLAWLMMSYPVLIASRKATRNWVFIIGGFGLMAWDLFLDPQMVSAGRWNWKFNGASVPFEKTIPLSNAAGWLFCGMILMAILHKALPRERRKKFERTKHVDFFLIWILISGVVGNLFFFNAPGVALVGGIAFALFLIPFLYKSLLGIPELN